MKKIFYILMMFSVGYVSSQVRFTGLGHSIVNSSAFIDASSNNTNNITTGTGKGLVFPRVDLSTFTFVGGSGIGNNFPTRFDGMIVYNTKEGGAAGAGSTQGTLTSGFWYYDNKTLTATGGTWKPLGSGATVATNNIISVTTPTYTAVSTDGTLLVDVPSGGATVNLPAATTNKGVVLTIKKVDTTDSILTFSSSIKLSPADSFTTLNYPKTLKIQSDGTDWWLIN